MFILWIQYSKFKNDDGIQLSPNGHHVFYVLLLLIKISINYEDRPATCGNKWSGRKMMRKDKEIFLGLFLFSFLKCNYYFYVFVKKIKELDRRKINKLRDR